jgi:16S rRNA (guanine966-N2)-methyltransferase
MKLPQKQLANNAMSKKPVKRGGNQTVRIIGGEWRGRKLHFPAVAGLRPTLDRLRETLFNWLMFEIEGKRCLDVFAGSGALGLEALSRRARSVMLIEQHPRAMEAIKGFLHQVQDTRAKLIEADALRILSKPASEPFDVVFLDPPFHQGLLARSIALLEKNGWLADNAWIYVESEPTLTIDHFPAHWDIHREINTSGKQCLLLKRHMPAPPHNSPADNAPDGAAADE